MALDTRCRLSDALCTAVSCTPRTTQHAQPQVDLLWNSTCPCVCMHRDSTGSSAAGGGPHVLLQGAALVSAPRASQVLVQLVVRLLQVRQPRFYLPTHTRQVTGAAGWSAGTSMQTRSATTVQSLCSHYAQTCH
jgi:hypothetical protein